ncbi:hypothetical protein JYT92_00575 [bacterium AH-315-L15]|nr:hypothetical protein [bacterium AH-315-L15]
MTNVNDKSEVLSDHQVRALVQLLTDENIEVAETVRAKILELGSRVIPFLHEVLEQKDEGLRGQAQDFLTYFREEEKLHQFDRFSNGSVNLEEGVFLLAQVAYPDLNVEAYRKILDDMAGEIAKRLNWNDDPERVNPIAS